MADTVPKRFCRLATQCAARAISDRARNHQGQGHTIGIEYIFNCMNGGLRIQRIKNSLDENKIDTARNQPARGLGISSIEFIIIDVAHSGVIHVGRDRGCSIGWPHGPSHKTGSFGVLLFPLIRHRTRQPRRFDIQLIGDRLQCIISLRDRG